MKIEETRNQGVLILALTGRLDASGAASLETDLDAYVRRGEYNLRLGLEQVEFLSSAGIRVLLSFRKKLTSIDGGFSVTVAEGSGVKDVLEMAGLTELFDHISATDHPGRESGDSFVREGIRLEVLKKSTGKMSFRSIGTTAKLRAGIFTEKDAEVLSFPAGSLGMGIGALGESFEGCRRHFGELLVLGGAAITESPGATEVDYMLAREQVIPECCMLSGFSMTGSFDTVFRFDSAEEGEVVDLSRLGLLAADLVERQTVAVALVAEAAELVGAALIKSPAEKQADEDVFAFPGIRDWFSFTGEPVHSGSTVMALGIVSQNPSPHDELLRPLGDDLYGMVKAAVFNYAPLSRNQTDLAAMTQHVFAQQKLMDLLHLLNDDRPLGAGQSSFRRGTVWVAALDEVSP